MCRVEQSDKGAGVIRFGIREWLTMAGLALTAGTLVASLSGYIIHLQMEVVGAEMAAIAKTVEQHVSNTDAHASLSVQTQLFLTRLEFDRWREDRAVYIRSLEDRTRASEDRISRLEGKKP